MNGSGLAGEAPQSNFEATLTQAGREWIHDPEAVYEILRWSGIATPDLLGAVEMVPIVAVAENYYQDPSLQDESSYCRNLLQAQLQADTSGVVEYKVGIALATMRNVRAEHRRFRDAADAVLVDEGYSGSIEARHALSSVMRGDVKRELPPELKVERIMPRTSVKKVDSVRRLITESDVEGFAINVARNIALVEDPTADEGDRLRAAMNIRETLVHVLRMFGQHFHLLEERAWDKAWAVVQMNNPQTHAEIQKTIKLATDGQQPVITFLREKILLSSQAHIIRRRIKDSGSSELKCIKKGISPAEIPDALGISIACENDVALVAQLRALLEFFDAYKHYRYHDEECIVSLCRPDKINGVPTDEPVVLDIAQAQEIWEALNHPRNVRVSKPKDSGFQAVHVNLIFKVRGTERAFGVELQIGTRQMHILNRTGEAIAAIYKLNPESQEDYIQAGAIVESIRKRAEAYISGDGVLTMNSWFRLLELFPDIDNELSKQYRVMRVGNKRIAVPRILMPFLDEQSFSTEFHNEEAAMLVMPVAHLDETMFRNIMRLDKPEWVNSDTKFNEALRLASMWHKTQGRRTGANHYEGHVLPIALAYYLNHSVMGEECSRDHLIALILHDAVEDAEDRETQQRRLDIIRRTFSDSVYSLVRIHTKPNKKHHESGEDLDRQQAKHIGLLRKELRQIVALQKVLDRAGSHNGDLCYAIVSGKLPDANVAYFLNTVDIFEELFMSERDNRTRALWLLTSDIFNAVSLKIS